MHTHIRTILDEIRDLNPIVVSGLAYGVDTIVHKMALELNLRTIGVLGSGLLNFYPKINKKLGDSIVQNGGAVVSEFSLFANPDRENFPKRNRIVAGLSDCTIVIQSAEKGGSLLTADLALSYNRDVFAIPGSVWKEQYKGTHKLIKYNKAALIEGGMDLRNMMGWEGIKMENIQIDMFDHLNQLEKDLVAFIRAKGKAQVDDLINHLKLPIHQLNSLLLSLELRGVLKLLPGKVYSL